jgi:hypothetical protein
MQGLDKGHRPQHFDPIASKLVASLAQPGGNVTGLSNFAVQLSANLRSCANLYCRASADGLNAA